MSPRALVTGGNGFLGSHLVRRLVEAGHEVRVLAQPGTDLDRIAGLDAEVVRGDLLDGGSLAAACAGVELVFHLAGVVQDYGPRALFERVNVGGTRALLAAAVSRGVRRLVFVSSLAVHRYRGFSSGDEAAPRDNAAHPYGGSKIACEDLLREADAASRIEAVIARPGVFPFGEGDRLVLPELVRNRRKLMLVGGGRARLCTVYAPNLADGLLRCAEVPAARGQVYVLADDETPTWRELFGALFGGLGIEPPRRSVPLALALFAAFVAELVSRTLLRGRPPAINLYRVSLVGRDCVFSNAKARRELGWTPRVPFPEAMARTVEWLQREGLAGSRGS
jgi:polyketide synthase